MGSLRQLLANKREMLEALKPFAEFAAQNVNDDGWTSRIHGEPISYWFGPSEFRALREVFDKMNAKS